MESFFGRLKTHILSLIALCAEQETAEELVNNYLESHTMSRTCMNLRDLRRENSIL